jgi:hypothetical protein
MVLLSKIFAANTKIFDFIFIAMYENLRKIIFNITAWQYWLLSSVSEGVKSSNSLLLLARFFSRREPSRTLSFYKDNKLALFVEQQVNLVAKQKLILLLKVMLVKISQLLRCYMSW